MATFDVLLPVKDGIAFLAEALDSIVAQTFRDWRLIVLDHGSTDGSAELAAAYAERDVRIIVRAFPAAHGLAGLLNCGLELCDCRYVLRQHLHALGQGDVVGILAQHVPAVAQLEAAVEQP